MGELPMLRNLSSRASTSLIILGLSGCDAFMTVDGRVTDCSTGEPLVGVRATMCLGEGISDSEKSIAYSEPDGTFHAELNEPPSVSATLELDKPRYKTLRRTFSKKPDGRQQYCLEPQP
jgi:hypothetical protein